MGVISRLMNSKGGEMSCKDKAPLIVIYQALGSSVLGPCLTLGDTILVS